MRTIYRYPLKCMRCGLHFNVFSWNSDWTDEHYAFCPECGVQQCFPLGVEKRDNDEIYHHVGGVV